MRMLGHKTTLLGTLFTCVAAQPLPALAQVFSSISFDEGITATAPQEGSSQTVTGTTLPIQQTVTASTTYGGTVTATYNITDDGSVATFDIAATGSITPNDYGVYAGSAGNGTTFNFTRPVKYTATIAESGDRSMSCFVIGGGAYINATISDSVQTYSGIIYPEYESVSFGDSWGLSNSLTPTSQSGADHIHFTFTAIPEPSSTLLAGIPAAALRLRQRQRIWRR